MSLIFVHIGGLSQDDILNLDYPFYKDALKELCLKLDYEDSQILMARDYCDNKTIKQITSQNPLRVDLDNISKKSLSGKRMTLGMLREMGVIKN